MAEEMALKSDDIFDTTTSLTFDFKNLNLSESDLESVLAEDSDKETDISKDCEKDLKTPVGKDETTTEELISSESKIDINGNEETIPDENCNQSSHESELSDSDNEEIDDEISSKLTERGKISHSKKYQNRTNILNRNERYDRSQIPPSNLAFLSGSTLVQQTEFAYQFSSANNHVFSASENVNAFICSNPVSTPFSVPFEERRVGSPESGYESSLTGSPPGPLLYASVSSNLDLIPESPNSDLISESSNLDPIAENDDVHVKHFANLVENECALIGQEVPRYDIDNRDPQEHISNIVKSLKAPMESSSKDNLQDNNSRKLAKLGFKLKEDAKLALRSFLSNDEYEATCLRIYEEIRKRKADVQDIGVIRVIEKMDKTRENRTNLHHAVLNSNIAEIFCLVEIHKQYNKGSLSDVVNIRDRFGKTVLDYAIEDGDMALVVNYLKENNASQNQRVIPKVF